MVTRWPRGAAVDMQQLAPPGPRSQQRVAWLRSSYGRNSQSVIELSGGPQGGHDPAGLCPRKNRG